MSTSDPMDLASLSDDDLLAELRRVAEDVDPTPASWLNSARAVFELRSLDAELLTLLSDSLIDADPALTRGPGSAREITFGTRDGSVEVGLSVQTGGTRRHVVGHLVEASPTSARPVLRVHSSRGGVEVSVDESGLFAARDLPPGPVRLEFTVSGRRLLLSMSL
jgi:hypothetical protein